MVLPRTTTGSIVMVDAWRPGLQVRSLWAPGGIIDPGESPLEAAKRELAEETGFVGGNGSRWGAMPLMPTGVAGRCTCLPLEMLF